MNGDLKVLRTDVAVLGSGAAGMMAALKARESGANVLLLSKGPLGRGTCTTMAAGRFSGSSGSYSASAHREATLEAGRGINDPSLVDCVVEGAQAALEELRALGVPLEPDAKGFRVEGPQVGHRVPGNALAEAMRQLVRKRGAASLDGFEAVKLLVGDGEIAGVSGLAADGTPLNVFAGAVVLATGGACGLYERNDNPSTILGDGYALALRAGCPLRDMEFVQFYPVGLAQPGIPQFLVYPPYPPEARACDREGKDLLGELGACRDLGAATTRFRDTASLLFWKKHLEGDAYLDLTGVTEERWSSSYALRVLSRSSFDFRRRPCPIAPIAHFFVGGVTVDRRMETSVPGLFAAGEVVGGLHGANRLGGNALSECVVCGGMAGANAAAHARETAAPAAVSLGPQVHGSATPGTAYRNDLRRVRAMAWKHAGVVREAAGMAQGLAAVEELEGELHGRAGGREIKSRHQHRIESALLVLRCILSAGLVRQESRGAFFRSDYPERNDALWRRSLQVRLSEDGRVVASGAP